MWLAFCIQLSTIGILEYILGERKRYVRYGLGSSTNDLTLLFVNVTMTLYVWVVKEQWHIAPGNKKTLDISWTRTVLLRVEGPNCKRSPRLTNYQWGGLYFNWTLVQNLLQNNHKIDYILCFIRWKLKWNSDNVRETKLCFVWILTGSQITNHIFERKCRTAVPDWGKRENFFLSRPFINSNPSVRLFLWMATPYIIPPIIVLCDAWKF